LAGSSLTLYFANRASEEPPVSFREIARPLVRGVVALAALAAVGLGLIWFVAAAFVSGSGCAWIVGVGGCLPAISHPVGPDELAAVIAGSKVRDRSRGRDSLSCRRFTTWSSGHPAGRSLGSS
jgi:hypothetical protein